MKQVFINRITAFVIALVLTSGVNAQEAPTDSVYIRLNALKEDTNKVNELNRVALSYRNKNSDSAEAISKMALDLSNKLKWEKGAAEACRTLGICATTRGNYSEANEYYFKALEINQKLKDKPGTASIYTSLGVIKSRQGNFSEALDYYNKALKISEEENIRFSIANLLSNIGIVYKNQGDYSTALEHYFKALKIAEEDNNQSVIANCMNNIGLAYYRTDQLDKALEYYFKSVEMEIEQGDKRGIISAYSNMGNVYAKKRDYKKALEYYENALKISEEIDYQNGISNILANMGFIYLEEEKDKEKALKYFYESLKICEELNNKMGISSTLSSIADVLISENEIEKGEKMLKEALEIAKEIKSLSMIRNNEKSLSDLYSGSGQYELALKHYKNYVAIRDTMQNEESTRKFLQAQLQYDFDKKEATTRIEFEKQRALASAELEKRKLLLEKNKQELVLLEKENELKELSLAQSNSLLRQKQAEAESQQNAIELLNKDKLLKEAEAREKEEAFQKQKLITYIISGGGILILAFLVLVIKGYIEKKKANRVINNQKREVERQKEIVEEKQKEILDSILYAKRLQDAILPPEKLVRECLSDSFIFYQPKDIVAGDFYWMEKLGDTVFLAAADCTGHGVPGAMVAVVCSNALNRAVKEFGITDPGKILDKVRDLVIETFEKSESEVKDGMDISLCAINKGTLRWSGANNPLWLIRQGGSEVENIRPDKQPIGRYATKVPFTTHEINLFKGDSIYLFTDGLADQFGGDKGKKFKYKQFQELLLEMKDKRMDLQKSILSCSLEKWRGDIEQVDDILVMGLRV